MANDRPTIEVYPKRGMSIEWHNAEIAYADSKEIIVRTNDDNLLHSYATDKISYIQKIQKGQRMKINVGTHTLTISEERCFDG